MAKQDRPNPLAEPEIYSYGSNNLNAKEIFFERLKYDFYVFPDFLIRNFVSTWTTERLYGLVNNKGNTSVPDLISLKSLRFNSDDSVNKYALNFVADAWYDLAKKLRELAAQNITFKDSPWASPQVVKAWEPVQDSYDLYMREKIYPVFYDEFLYSNGRNQKIRNIDSFMNYFSEFTKNIMTKAGPVTLSGFIESTYAPLYSSGLIIEIADDNYDDDFNKAFKFGDSNFSLVASIASQYGFSIDKNIPWRLVADLRNPAMVEYMLGVPIVDFDIGENVDYECDPLIGAPESPPMAYGYSQIPGFEDVRRRIAFYTYQGDNGETKTEPGYERYKRQNGDQWVPIFDKDSQPEIFNAMFTIDYTETWNLDINLLQDYLLFFYNYYVSLQPDVPVQTLSPYDSSCGPRNYTFSREIMSKEDFVSTYGDRWKLKTFYIVRNLERNRTVPNKRKLIEIQRIMNNYNLASRQDLEAAYTRALRVAQNEFIGPADTGTLTLDTVGDIIRL